MPLTIPAATPTETRQLLHTFPYYQNYLDLSRIECSTLSAFLPCSTSSTPNFAFIGSGPLPLTSLCLLDIYPSVHVHNIDRDISALQISRDLCDRLGYTERMTFACTDVSADNDLSANKTKWEGFDVVFLAALVGMDTQSKLSILGSLAKKLKTGALVVARSAKGLRSVLYPVSRVYDVCAWVMWSLLTWRRSLNSRMTWKRLGWRHWLKCIRGLRW